MPKLKTKKAVAKRFRLTKKGKFKYKRAGKGHILTKKSRKRKRGLKQRGLADAAHSKILRRLLPYG